jgi:hypothetical protein
VICAELFELFGFGRGGRSGDDARAGCFGELQGEDGDAACALGQDGLAWFQGARFKAVEGVPGGEGGAGEGTGFGEGEVCGHGDEPRFVEDGVLAQGAVDGAAEAGCEGLLVQGAGEVGLVEEGYDFIWGEVLVCVNWDGSKEVGTSWLEACYAFSDRLDCAGTVGAGDDVVLCWEGVFALGDDEVAVV